VIVVVGNPAWNPGPPPGPGGRAASIGVAAAGAGARVELVGRIGDDAAGDALVAALTRAAVGHAALLRDPVRPTLLVAAPDAEDDDVTGGLGEAGDVPSAGPGSPGGPSLDGADVGLALRYLADFGVLVVADDAPARVLPACIEAAAYAGAHLVAVVAASDPMPDGLPPEATVLQAPDDAGEGFARLLGRYAAALDAGADPAAAFATATGDGWERPGA
jgi:hypothetical protein